MTSARTQVDAAPGVQVGRAEPKERRSQFRGAVEWPCTALKSVPRFGTRDR